MHTTVFLFLIFFFLSCYMVVMTLAPHQSSSLTACSFCFISCRAHFHSCMTVAGADSVPSILLGRVTATVTGEVTMGERGKERRSEGRRIKTDNNGRVPEYRYTCTDTALALQSTSVYHVCYYSIVGKAQVKPTLLLLVVSQRP